LKLFENYLANWTYFVSIEDIQSQKVSVTCGVPQGSNIGPLFFLLYVNDITHVSKFKTTLFADDTVLSFSAKSVIDLNTLKAGVQYIRTLISAKNQQLSGALPTP